MHYISLVPTFFMWWYGRGLKDLFSFLSALFSYTSNMFSVKTLLKTLFSPWKKMVGEREKGIEGLKLWLLDSFISRIVGFIVRILMMVVFFLSLIVLAVFAVLVIVFWIGMPVFLLTSFVYIFIGYDK